MPPRPASPSIRYPPSAVPGSSYEFLVVLSDLSTDPAQSIAAVIERASLAGGMMRTPKRRRH